MRDDLPDTGGEDIDFTVEKLRPQQGDILVVTCNPPPGLEPSAVRALIEKAAHVVKHALATAGHQDVPIIVLPDLFALKTLSKNQLKEMLPEIFKGEGK